MLGMSQWLALLFNICLSIFNKRKFSVINKQLTPVINKKWCNLTGLADSKVSVRGRLGVFLSNLHINHL